jgi:hypothetical protein
MQLCFANSAEVEEFPALNLAANASAMWKEEREIHSWLT